MSFEKNVFINCPFDDSYKHLLWPLIYAILYFELEPKISQTVSSGNVRVEEIKKLIQNAKYSIHDISRGKPLNNGDVPRFNMPFEMGLDIGCQTYGSGKLKSKKCLILETEKYYYQQIISDISGQDIKDHNDNAKQLVSKVREWFVAILNNHLPGLETIWDDYTEFNTDTSEKLAKGGYGEKGINALSFTEFLLFAKPWIMARRHV